MDLPLAPPLRPMLAAPATTIPRGPGWNYEPKWDGFRCLVFRDAGQVELISRSGRPLHRYFPELIDELRSALAPRCVLDGEIVLVTERGLDFDALQLRLHPADSRVALLARQTPASFVAFDLLALDDRALLETPFHQRRTALDSAVPLPSSRVQVTPLTRDYEVAQDWFTRFEGAGFDGVVAKADALAYQPGKRVMLKIKHERTADCVLGGFRWHKDGRGIGSVLLGLYDRHGQLQHVGVASGFTAARRADLVTELEPHRMTSPEDHPWSQQAASAGEDDPDQRVPGGRSRWNAGKDASWEPLRPDLVAEVRYEHLQSGRFRHMARLVRLRPDRDPKSCDYAQLDEAAPAEFATLFGQTPLAEETSRDD